MSKTKSILRYLKGKTSMGLTYNKDAEVRDELSAYVEANHAGNMDKRYSTTRSRFALGRGAGSLEVVEEVVAVSTLGSEYVALSKARLMVTHVRHRLKTTSVEKGEAAVPCEDNLGAVATSRIKITPHTKHIGLTFHHARSLVADNVVDVKYVDEGFNKGYNLT